ncbi:MAG: ribosome biogenesis GTPase Der [Gemmatimonadetes bacterium]|nr:ribosome biogenesis GTPase Der [Gemmatimonadota bacterium]
MTGKLPIVAVVGRPNVGKSTFFNRILGEKLAIVDDQPGVTRDRNFARADWAGREFFLVDTGGVIEGSDEPLDRAVREQAMAAVAEADVILFLVDSKAGPHPLDQRLGDVLRKAGRPVLVVANKVDNLPNDSSWMDFWSLGLGEPIPVAAASGKGTGDLLDKVLAALPAAPEMDAEPDEIRIAVIGRPNVGKSSFVNRMFGEERVVVSEIAGTTRDPVDTPMLYHGKKLVFVDTAGLRRQAKVKDSLEYYSALRTARVVDEADVALVLMDATEKEMHIQDIKVAEMAWEAGAGVIVVVNKWDLVEKETMTAPHFEKQARARVPFLQAVPFLFTSALTGQRVHKALDLVLEVQEQRGRRIDTHEVNEALAELIRHQHPPHSRGRQVKLRYATQVSVAPPTFVIFSNLPREVPENYIRFLLSGFRERWGFMGSPIRIQLRASAPGRG